MKQIFLFFMGALVVGTADTAAQTKKIAFESHSGNAAYFNLTLNNDFFESDASNFGLPAHKNVHKIQKIIFLTDSQTVLVSEIFDRPFSATNDSSDIFVKNQKDTLLNSYMFNKNVSTDSLKKLLQYYDKYEINDKTKVVNKIGKVAAPKKNEGKANDNQKNNLPIAVFSDDAGSGDNPRPSNKNLFAAGLIFSFALIGGLLCRAYYKIGVKAGLTT